jgi:hypothetical protein
MKAKGTATDMGLRTSVLKLVEGGQPQLAQGGLSPNPAAPTWRASSARKSKKMREIVSVVKRCLKDKDRTRSTPQSAAAYPTAARACWKCPGIASTLRSPIHRARPPFPKPTLVRVHAPINAQALPMA